MSEEPKWSDVTMAIINRMTPQITGKSFDPEWFILCQRFKEVDTLRTRIKELEAQAAVMREKIDQAFSASWTNDDVQDGHYFTPASVMLDLKQAALSTSAGKSLIERLKEAEYLLRHAGDPNWSLNYEQSKDWLKRRDAFLNPTPQNKGNENE